MAPLVMKRSMIKPIVLPFWLRHIKQFCAFFYEAQINVLKNILCNEVKKRGGRGCFMCATAQEITSTKTK